MASTAVPRSTASRKSARSVSSHGTASSGFVRPPSGTSAATPSREGGGSPACACQSMISQPRCSAACRSESPVESRSWWQNTTLTGSVCHDRPVRHDGRSPAELRPLDLLPDFMLTATGSVLFSIGRTRVICTASVQEEVPRWMRGKGRGWVTAEYGMLPASTGDRKQRDATRGKVDGRTVEIQRLIGRSLRAIVELDRLGERTVWIDCDVLQADGGTRCASICGGYVAMYRALATLVDRGLLAELPLSAGIAAVSCGIVDGEPVLDLDYSEDSRAEVDMNVVMTDDGRLIEIQGTAEGQPFDRVQLDRLLELAATGIQGIDAAQRAAVLHGR